MRVAAAAAIIAIVGCGGETEPPPAPVPVGCGADMLVVGGECVPVAVGAGMSEDECADGFVHDGLDACQPVLPDAPCPAGEIAVPGMSECAPLAECGEALWGNIETDGATQYVDAAFAGTSNGSADAPWTTISAGVAAASPGATVAIAAGSYPENVVVTDVITLWGRCPELVVVDGGSGTAVEVSAAAAVVRGLQLGGVEGLRAAADAELTAADLWVRGDARGVLVDDSAATVTNSLVQEAAELAVLLEGGSLHFDRSVVRDALRFGLVAAPGAGAAELIVTDSLVDRATRVGVFAQAATVRLARTVVRDTQPSDEDTSGIGYGVNVQSGAQLFIEDSVVERNIAIGVRVNASHAQLDRTTIADTFPDPEGARGVGIEVGDIEGAAEMGSASLRDVVLVRNADAAVRAFGTVVELERVVARDTAPRAEAAQEEASAFGNAVDAFPSPFTETTVAVSATDSLFERNAEVGLLLRGGSLTVSGCHVRDTSPNPYSGLFGEGIVAQGSTALSLAATLAVERTLVERSHESGIVLFGEAEATLDDSTVRDTLPRGFEATHGWGIGSQVIDGVAPVLTMRGSVVEGCKEAAISWQGGNLTMVDSVVRTTAPGDALGLGDGIALVNAGVPSVAVVTASRIESNARAGISVFGATLTLSDSTLSCNAFGLNAETFVDPPDLTDGGGNSCGCEELGECAAVSVGLAPPPPL